MGALLKFLLIVFGVYFIGKAIFRGVVSYLFGDVNKSLNEQIKRQQEELARYKKKQEGKITINYQPKPDKNFKREEGDYVDFEEVK